MSYQPFNYQPSYQPMYQPPNPAPYQQQINSMPLQYQQQPAQLPQMQQVGQSQPNVICRPVASEEEARGVPTDFSGATLVLTNFGGGKIYCKSLNYQDGSAIFRTFQEVSEQKKAADTIVPAAEIEYAPRAELDSLRAELESLRAELEESKKATAARKPATKGAATE